MRAGKGPFGANTLTTCMLLLLEHSRVHGKKKGGHAKVKHWMAVLAGTGNRHPAALIGCVPGQTQGYCWQQPIRTASRPGRPHRGSLNSLDCLPGPRAFTPRGPAIGNLLEAERKKKKLRMEPGHGPRQLKHHLQGSCKGEGLKKELENGSNEQVRHRSTHHLRSGQVRLPQGPSETASSARARPTRPLL
jgi:hypothetical protein